MVLPTVLTANQPPTASSIKPKPKGNICPRCEKPVYFAEEVKAVGQVKTSSSLINILTFAFSRFTNYATDVLTVKRVLVVQTFRNTMAIFMITVRY